MSDGDTFDGDVKKDDGLDIPHWIESKQWDMEDYDSGNALRALIVAMPKLDNFIQDTSNAKMAWGETSGMMPNTHANCPSDGVIVLLWGDDYEPEFQLDVEFLINSISGKKPSENNFRSWLEHAYRWTSIGRNYDKTQNDVWGLDRVQYVACVYFTFESIKTEFAKHFDALPKHNRRKALRALIEVRRQQGEY